MITRVLSFTEIRNGVGGEWAPYNTSSRSFPEIWFLPAFQKNEAASRGLRLIPQQKKSDMQGLPPKNPML